MFSLFIMFSTISSCKTGKLFLIIHFDWGVVMDIEFSTGREDQGEGNC